MTNPTAAPHIELQNHTILSSTFNPEGDQYGLTASDWRSIKARVFGQLASRACPIVEDYHSDLFHDAMWLDQWLNSAAVFYFSVRQCGTAIGTDENLVGCQPKEAMYEIHVQIVRNIHTVKVTLDITKLP